MKNTQLGLEIQLRVIKYIQLEDIQKLHLEIKDKAILNPGEESIIEECEIENGEKWNIVRSKEVEIENEMKLKTIDETNKLKEKLKIENKEIEKLSIEIKLKLEKKENIEKEINNKLKDKLKLNKDFQIKNSSYIKDEIYQITEKKNTIKNYIINLLFFIISLYTSCYKRREEKKLFQGRRRE